MDRYTIAFLIICGWFVVFKMFPARFELQTESATGVMNGSPSPTRQLSEQEIRGKVAFEGNCARCHDSRLERLSTGPGLMGISERIPPGDWIYQWVQNSQKLIASGDEYANKVWRENNKAAMDPFPSLNRATIDDIMAWIDGYTVY